MNIDMEEISLNIETAIPCGLLIDELVSNSLKYAFKNQTNCKLDINLHSDNDNMFTLVVSDNGSGIPKEVDINNSDTFGMQLIKYLTSQLKGKLELDRNNGTKFSLKFNELKYKDRV